MRKHDFIDFNVYTFTPFICITPIDFFNPVEFREELLTSTPKHSSHPELLRQLALEVINDVPDQALIIYTDGSRSNTGRAGSGIFSNTPGNDVKISIRNPDHCSVFRSEFIAISGALDHALNSYKDSIWILTDSRSCIQYLKNWSKIMDSIGLDNLSKLVRLGQRKKVCLQWIPSHVREPGNEAADELAGRGCDLPNPSSTVLTHSEIPSFQRNKMNLIWRNHRTHHWYKAKSPGLSLHRRSSRTHQTALARFRSGHLHGMTFVRGGCQVIYSQFGLAIHQNDHQARCRFVEWAQNEIAVVSDFHKRILFSDEAHFWLNGYVNKQNCHIWSEANPQVYVETPLHPEKLTVLVRFMGWWNHWSVLLQKR
ncbi:RNase H domain-containing protein [Trichonephila clavipes]|nr:RNase H domain-containing protein [Trichonephila clavipes]